MGSRSDLEHRRGVVVIIKQDQKKRQVIETKQKTSAFQTKTRNETENAMI